MVLDRRLCITAIRIADELLVASFADSESRNISDSLYDSKIALGHIRSLAYAAGMA
jgi:hypothetical protein